jgi:hypothetical protein
MPTDLEVGKLTARSSAQAVAAEKRPANRSTEEIWDLDPEDEVMT